MTARGIKDADDCKSSAWPQIIGYIVIFLGAAGFMGIYLLWLAIEVAHIL